MRVIINVEPLDHVFATFKGGERDGELAFCSCRHEGDLLEHARDVLPPAV